MGKRRTLLIVLILLAAMPMLSNNRTILLWGHVKDAFTNGGIKNVNCANWRAARVIRQRALARNAVHGTGRTINRRFCLRGVAGCWRWIALHTRGGLAVITGLTCRRGGCG